MLNLRHDMSGARARARNFKPGILDQFRTGRGVFSCGCSNIRWVVRRYRLRTFDVGSNAGGGDGVNVGGIGADGRLYERDVYARACGGDPPQDYGGLTAEYKAAMLLPYVA